MAKPTMPNIPGIGAMTDTIDFVKNLWGSMGIPGMNMTNMNIPGMPGMNIPGMVMPTLSVEEIQKKITDLKAVESWLNLNMGMLRSTIQALEVQAATLSTLQTMGESFTASMASATHAYEQPAATAAPAHNGNGGNGGNGHGAAGHGAEKLHHAPEPTSKDQTDAAALTAPLVNAAAWWNMLQEQFKQAVGSAMTTTEPSASAPAAEKPKAKPKARTTTATATAAGAAGTPRKRKTSK